MGKRGPKPKPTAIAAIQGNPGRRPLNKHEPKLDRSKPRAPSWLGKVARREWNRIVPMLHDAGVLAKADRAMVAAYCEMYARFVEANYMIDQTGGQVIERPSGVMVQNPYVKSSLTYLAEARRLASAFGLTPSDRGRLVIDDSGAESAIGFDLEIENLFSKAAEVGDGDRPV